MSREKVFISVPEDNQALADEKIAEVFAEGHLPMEPAFVCLIRGIRNTEHTRRKILAECQSIRVYGQEWTDQMWRDIRCAMSLDIPVHSDQDMIPGGRPIRLDDEPPQNNKPKRKKDAYER